MTEVVLHIYDVTNSGSEKTNNTIVQINKIFNDGIGLGGIFHSAVQGSGGGWRLYEAAVLLKSVVRDRAYLMVSERVDIAAAVNASGVVLSDQGLPAIVARNTMMDSKSESIVFPLVAKMVQSANAALSASNSEGADFLIYDVNEEKHVGDPVNSVLLTVKLPIFIMSVLRGEDNSFTEASQLLKSGASGFVVSLKDLGLFSDDVLSNMFTTVSSMNKKTQLGVEIFNNVGFLDSNNGSYGEKAVAGFIKLEDREKQFVERERSVLLEAIKVIQKAAPLMEEVSLLIDAVSQLDEPFSLVGEFNSGNVINALLGSRYLKEGVVPTTNEITFLRYSELGSDEQQRCERHPDGQYTCYLPAPILKEVSYNLDRMASAIQGYLKTLVLSRLSFRSKHFVDIVGFDDIILIL